MEDEMNRNTFATIAVYAPVAFLLLAISAPFARAAELKWLAPVAMKAAASEMAPKFEQASGHKVKIEYATVGAITERLRKGEAADVAIVSGQQIDELLKEGKIAAGSRAEVAKVGFALLIRKGAKKPNIGTVDAFKSTLLAAKTFSYNDPALGGPSGAYSAKLMDRLGIAAAIKPKLKLLPAGGAVAEAIAKGDIEMGITVASDAVNYPGVEIAGAMPAELQSYSIYAAGIVAGGKQAAAAKALTAYLTSPAAAAIFKAKGFE
jgi:molybdate transport system substrate-binding protein